MQNYFERLVFENVPNAQVQLSLAGTLMEFFIDLMSPLFQILSSRYGIKFVMDSRRAGPGAYRFRE